MNAQQQRRDHLGDVARVLHHRRDARPQPADQPRRRASATVSRTGPGASSRVATYAAAGGAEQQLALLADVRQAGLAADTIVPTATTSSGAAVVMVRPHAPGERRLPSSRALNTFDAEPPVARDQDRAQRRATVIDDDVERRPSAGRGEPAGRRHWTRLAAGARRRAVVPTSVRVLTRPAPCSRRWRRSLMRPSLPAAGRGARGRSRGAAISPTMRPRWITQTRSDSVSTSSSSVEISSTPTPARRPPAAGRSCTRWRRRRGRASAGRRRAPAGCADSSRASTTRCWLPPDSDRIGACGDAG